MMMAMVATTMVGAAQAGKPVQLGIVAQRYPWNGCLAVLLGLLAFGVRAETAIEAAAARAEALVETKFLDAGGVLMSALDANYERLKWPMPDGDETIDVPGRGCNYAEFSTYENTGMVQGAYLAAMVAKYRATGDAEALARARRTYRGICWTYRLSQKGGKGFYCKPWGRQYSDETSSDQYIYTLAGLDAFHSVATPAEKAEIADMITSMCAFWIDRKYRYTYYSHEIQWQKCRFLSFAALGAKYAAPGKKAMFEEEFTRLSSAGEVLGDVPFKGALRFGYDNKNAFGQIVWVNAENAMSGFLSVGFALRDHPDFAYAKNVLVDFRELVQASLAGDGTCYHILQPAGGGRWKELDPKLGFFKRPDRPAPWNWSLFGVTAPYRMGAQAAAMGVNALVQMAPYDAAAKDWCRASAMKELLAIEKAGFSWYADPHGVLPPQLKWMTRMRSGDAVANWLWAYWTLRKDGVLN